MLPVRLPVNRKLLAYDFGEIKNYMQIFNCMGSALISPALLKVQLYLNSGLTAKLQ